MYLFMVGDDPECMYVYAAESKEDAVAMYLSDQGAEDDDPCDAEMIGSNEFDIQPGRIDFENEEIDRYLSNNSFGEDNIHCSECARGYFESVWESHIHEDDGECRLCEFERYLDFCSNARRDPNDISCSYDEWFILPLIMENQTWNAS